MLRVPVEDPHPRAQGGVSRLHVAPGSIVVVSSWRESVGHANIIIWIDEGWYVGKLKEVPGIFSQCTLRSKSLCNPSTISMDALLPGS